MKRTALLLMLSMPIFVGCQATVPVAVDCPKPPPLPVVLTLPASTGPSLLERYERSTETFRGSLEKAQRQP